MQAMQIAPQRTFPKEIVQRMVFDYVASVTEKYKLLEPLRKGQPLGVAITLFQGLCPDCTG
jgi:hypothetical protein